MNYRDYSGPAAAVRDYELKLEARLNVKHVIAVSSGTAAIHAGLVALGVGKGSRGAELNNGRLKETDLPACMHDVATDRRPHT
ncbi:DegT/DnrJ/EryC1/StrS family aminotransferase [Pantoea allii]|uniref:DegT/DnrJ/EryC1/StrS family aminotransferase n=1 Tax=Pantoea allii TaxID=574096 RepID=UPI003D31CF07